MFFLCVCFFCFKQKTAYEMRISDWSSDVCSSDLLLTIAMEFSDLPNKDEIADQIRKLTGERDPNKPLTDEEAQQQQQALEQQAEALQTQREEIGRASCRERVCKYV